MGGVKYRQQVAFLYHRPILHRYGTCIKLIDKLYTTFYYAQKESCLQGLIILICLVILAFLVSVPCGYIRQNYAKYSFMWFLLVHIPIPFIVLLRIEAGLSWHYIPLTLGGAIGGQLAGGYLSRRRKKQNVKAG